MAHPEICPSRYKTGEDVAIADFNGDGKPDLVFCSEDDFPNGEINVHEYYLGNGAGEFTSASFQLPDSEANAVISAFINNDTFPDLLFGNNGGTGVLINNGDGTFTSETNRVPQLNKTSQDLALADVDGDGDQDLLEGNENGNILHINDGSGFYADESLSRLPQGLNIETRKIAFGDIDNDNDLDVFLSNVAFIPGKDQQNRLFQNDGTGHFTDITSTNLPVDNDLTIDAIFEDIDLDEDLDLIVCNVFGAPIKIYENDGNGNFTDHTQNVLGQNYFRDALGVIAEDLNGDGFRDLYICDRRTPNSSNKDLLLLRKQVSSTQEKTNKKHESLIYPNPVKSYFYLNTNIANIDSVKLFDHIGKYIATLNAEKQGQDKYLFHLNDLVIPAGTYLLDIKGLKKTIFIAR